MQRHPLRVLLISPTYHGGGAERCARELFERLPEFGVQTAMWVARRGPHDPPGVEEIRLPGERWLYPLDYLPTINDWRHFGSRRRLDAIQAGDFDVVHLHNIHGRWISIKALKRLCARIPVVWTLHDEWAATGGIPYDLTRLMPEAEARRRSRRESSFLFTYPNRRTARLRKSLDVNMPQPRVLISPSQYLWDLVRQSQRFPMDRVRRIPYGVTLLNEPGIHMDRAAARAELGIPRDVPVVLLIAANLSSPFKGMDHAMEAIARLRHWRLPTSPMVLILGHGASPIAQRLSSQARVVTGYATDSRELARAFRVADVTLVPSIADNLPYVVLESFACQTPVVAFRVGGLGEMIGDDERGLLSEPFDTGQMAAQLATLLTNPNQRESLGALARQWVDRCCHVPGYLKRLVEIYDSVTARA